MPVSVTAMTVRTVMPSIICAVVLMEIGNFTRRYYAYSIRMKSLMPMHVIIVMATIIFTVVLMHFFYGAIRNRVKGNASDI